MNRFRGMDEAMLTLCRTLTSRGQARQVERRGQPMLEVGPLMFCLTEPRRRICTLRERKLDPWVSLAEFPWLISGRNDVAWLEPYLPRARDFSDDGLTWRAGYGPRMRQWVGMERVTDQLAEVVARLAKDPNTRQAVISLWDPEDDNCEGSKDYPCTNWLHFIRDPEFGGLDLHVTMRSNDLWWGFSGVNVINFTLLLELVAACLDWPVGHYYHTVSNLHIYESRHGEAARALARNNSFAEMRHWAPLWLDVRGTTPSDRLEYFTADARVALEMVEERRSGTEANPPAPMALIGNRWLETWGNFMLLHKGSASREKIVMMVPEDWAAVMPLLAPEVAR